jgi:hypothetical protein
MSNLSCLNKEELVNFLYDYCQRQDDLKCLTKQIIDSSALGSLAKARYAIINGNCPSLVTRLLAIHVIFDYAKRNHCTKQLSLQVLSKQPDTVLLSASADIQHERYPRTLQGFLSRQLTLI